MDMKKLIIICGMHRNETSIIAQLVRSMGAYLGERDEVAAAGSDSLDDFFEQGEIVRLDNEILRICHMERYSLEVLEPVINRMNLQTAKAMEGIKAVLQKLFAEKDVVAVKDPGISLLLPLWEDITEALGVEAKYIWIFRNPLEVSELLWKSDGYSTQHSLLLWMRHHLGILRFLSEKDYLTVHYRDISEDFSILERIGCFLGLPYDDSLKEKWSRMVKYRRDHSGFVLQDVRDRGMDLLTDFYGTLLEHREADADVAAWGMCYRNLIPKAEDCFMDYEILKDTGCLNGKEIVIYGAGHYGQQASEMLRDLGHPEHHFCDKDIRRHGTDFMGRKILSVKEAEKKEGLLFIIAIADREIQKAVGQTLACIGGVKLLSFFALEKAWKYTAVHCTGLRAIADVYWLWHNGLGGIARTVRDAYASQVLIYQAGKVGSSTVYSSLKKAGIKSAHIHRFAGINRLMAMMMADVVQKGFGGGFFFDSPEYKNLIKREMKGRKIITMVRDPIAVDLATVFQWFGSGESDWYFRKEIGQGRSFQQAVVKLALKIQNRLFDWFDAELKELFGIDVFAHPFNHEKGYTVIRENDVEVLLIKTEKLSGLAGVIGDFVGLPQFELVDTNIGAEKEYAHIYRKTKENLVLPKEYVDFYYEGNPRMDHFYSGAEREAFKRKWRTE